MSVEIDIEKKIGSFHLRTAFSGGDESIALLGASGCGKSLTLKCIAGIERPDRGRIIVDGVTLFDSEKGIDLSPQERHTGFMFQNYALFPNMTVEENIRVGAMREKDKVKRERSIEELIESFALTDVRRLYPRQLSGGQQQRTALARILVSKARILLLDEPFSALDSHLRFRLEQEIREVIRSFGKSVILVSHDRDEVFRLSDKIAVMGKGCIEMFASRDEVFSSPRTVNAAVLTGCKNISRCRADGQGRVVVPGWGLTLEGADGAADITHVAVKAGGILSHGGDHPLECGVEAVMENPLSVSVTLRPVGGVDTLLWELDKKEWEAIRGEKITVGISGGAILYLKGERA